MCPNSIAEPFSLTFNLACDCDAVIPICTTPELSIRILSVLLVAKRTGTFLGSHNAESEVEHANLKLLVPFDCNSKIPP